MEEVLAVLPGWVQPIVVSVITVVVIYLANKAIAKGVSLRYGGGSIRFGDSKKVDDSPHSGCPHAKDVVIIINKVIDVVSRKLEIKHFQTLRSQMNYAEERAGKIVSMLQKIYLNLLREKGCGSLVDSMEFQAYRHILMVIREHVLNNVRFSFREDRFWTYTEAEFADYVKRRAETIIAMASDFMNEAYFCSETVSREELYAANMESKEEYQNIIYDVYQNARRVSLNSRTELEDLDGKLEEMMESFVGA